MILIRGFVTFLFIALFLSDLVSNGLWASFSLEHFKIALLIGPQLSSSIKTFRLYRMCVGEVCLMVFQVKFNVEFYQYFDCRLDLYLFLCFFLCHTKAHLQFECDVLHRFEFLSDELMMIGYHAGLAYDQMGLIKVR